jgi:hypothetical protein
MSGYCIDCTHYLKGGTCGKTKKTISPLMQYICFEGTTKNQQTTETMEENKTKKCSICGRELPLEEYHKNARLKDGLASFCKECHKAAAKKGGRGHRKIDQLTKAEPVNEEKPADQPQTSPQVEAVKALGKVFGAEKIADWMEVNEAYKLFVRYFE